MWQDRLLSVDLVDGFIQNWKKDEDRRRVPISEIKSVKRMGPDSFSISFEGGIHDYKLQAESPALQSMYAGIVEKIIQKGFVPKKDDEFFPPYRCATAPARPTPFV